MTDYEKFQQFFVQMGIVYEEDEFPDAYTNGDFTPSRVMKVGAIFCFDATDRYVGYRDDEYNKWVSRKESNHLHVEKGT